MDNLLSTDDWNKVFDILQTAEEDKNKALIAFEDFKRTTIEQVKQWQSSLPVFTQEYQVLLKEFQIAVADWCKTSISENELKMLTEFIDKHPKLIKDVQDMPLDEALKKVKRFNSFKSKIHYTRNQADVLGACATAFSYAVDIGNLYVVLTTFWIGIAVLIKLDNYL